MSDKKKNELKRISTSSIERNFKLFRSVVAAGVVHSKNLLVSKMTGVDVPKDSLLVESLRPFVDEISKLKGAAQKSGQFLSMVGDSLFPGPVVDLFKTLQSESQPLAWSQIEKIIRKRLGPEAYDQLEISQTPLGIASIGQVHMATVKKTGDTLALKIQYPGVEDSIESDLATLKRILQGLTFLPKIPNIEAVFSEVKQMMKRETDYLREKEMTDFFRTVLSNDQRFVVPRTYDDFCRKKILATSFEVGEAISDKLIEEMPDEDRRAIATAFLDLYFFEFFELGVVQTDPHFGNYRLRLTPGKPPVIVLLDFGAVRKFPKDFISDYKKMVLAVLENRPQDFYRFAERIGIVTREGERDQKLWELALLTLTPFLKTEFEKGPKDFDSMGRFHWGTSDLGLRVSQLSLKNKFDFSISEIPGELVFLDRKIAGVFTFLKKFNVAISSREILMKYLVSTI